MMCALSGCRGTCSGQGSACVCGAGDTMMADCPFIQDEFQWPETDKPESSRVYGRVQCTRYLSCLAHKGELVQCVCRDMFDALSVFFLMHSCILHMSSNADIPGLLNWSSVSPLLAQTLCQALDTLVGMGQQTPFVHCVGQVRLFECTPPHRQHQQHLQKTASEVSLYANAKCLAS